MNRKVIIFSLFFTILFLNKIIVFAVENNYYCSENNTNYKISASEEKIFNYINSKRVENNLTPFSLSISLSELARDFSNKFDYLKKKPTQEEIDKLKSDILDTGISDTNLSYEYIYSSSLENALDVLLTPDNKELIFSKEFNSVGIGIKELKEFLKPTLFFITIIFLERKVTLEPFPKYVEPDQTVKLSGYLNFGFINPVLKMTTPRGEVITIPLKKIEDNYFEAEVKFDAGLGAYSLEILVEDKYGPSIAHILPVTVGKKENFVISQSPESESEIPDFEKNQEELENNLFILINKSRSQFNLPPLEFNRELSQIARLHSEKMQTEKKVAHILSDKVNVSDLLKKYKIFHSAVAENVALNSTIKNAHQSLLESPAHREAILSEKFNEVGIGIIKDNQNGLLYITEIFVKKIQEVSPEEAELKILNLINENRAQLELPLLKLHPKLNEIAKSHSKMMAETDKIQNITNFGKILKEKNIKYSAGYSEVLRTSKLDDVLNIKAIQIKNLRYLGVGVIQSAQSEHGCGIFYISLIFIR